MAIDPFSNCNYTIEDHLCTLETCCLAQSSFLYIPTYGGNIFFTIFFAVFIVPQAALMIWKKSWGFGVGMIAGLILEVIGYAARIMLHNNPFDKDAFLMYLICLTIAPVFVTAAIYLSLSRIMVLYGTHLSVLSPRVVSIGFMTSDFCSLVLQALGGALADTADNHTDSQRGINIMIAGLLLQAISIGAFLVFMAYFSFRVRKGVPSTDAGKRECRNRTLFKIFLHSLVVATLAVLTRSIFRVAELWGGFSGRLWNDETDFLVLDGAMMAFAVLLLTIFHPGVAFGEQWAAANWSLKKSRRVSSESMMPMK